MKSKETTSNVKHDKENILVETKSNNNSQKRNNTSNKNDNLGKAGAILNLFFGIILFFFWLLLSIYIIGIPFLILDIFGILYNIRYLKNPAKNKLPAGILGLVSMSIIGGIFILVTDVSE